MRVNRSDLALFLVAGGWIWEVFLLCWKKRILTRELAQKKARKPEKKKKRNFDSIRGSLLCKGKEERFKKLASTGRRAEIEGQEKGLGAKGRKRKNHPTPGPSEGD